MQRAPFALALAALLTACVPLLAQRPIEIGQGLVAQRAQPGGHDADLRALGSVQRYLVGVGHLGAAGDAAVGQADQAFADVDR